MEDQNQLRPMEFGKILGTGWRLTARTAPTAGLLMLLAYLPVAIIGGSLAHELFRMIGDIISDPALMNNPNPDDQAVMRHVMPLMGTIAGLIPLGIFFWLLMNFAQVAATIAGWEELNGNRLGFGELMKRSFGRPYGFTLLQGLAIFGIMMLANGAMAFLGAVVGVVTLGIGTILLQVAYQVALIYIWVAIGFRVHQIAILDRGPWQALISSIALVKNNWWRVFGPLFVMGLVIAVLITPLIVSLFVPFIEEMVALERNSGGREPDPMLVAAAMARLSDNISPVTLGLIALISALGLLLMTHTLTALYADLRARRGDFLPHGELDDDEDLTITMVS